MECLVHESRQIGSGQIGDGNVNVNILGISKLKWTGMGEFTSDDHYIYYCGQESLRRKGVRQGCILSPCLFNFYAEYIITNAGLEEAQAGIKIAGRNISNPRYADDTTLMAENGEELKSLLMKVKEESEKVSLKLKCQSLFF